MSVSSLATLAPAPELHSTRFWVAYFMLAAFPTYPSEACWQQLSLLLTMPWALLPAPFSTLTELQFLSPAAAAVDLRGYV